MNEILREIGMIARALDSISKKEFKESKAKTGVSSADFRGVMWIRLLVQVETAALESRQNSATQPRQVVLLRKLQHRSSANNLDEFNHHESLLAYVVSLREVMALFALRTL